MELKVNKKEQPIAAILKEIERLRQEGVDVANVWIITNIRGIFALQSVGAIKEYFNAPRVDFILRLETKIIGVKEHKVGRKTAYEIAWITNDQPEEQCKPICQTAEYISWTLEYKDGEDMLLLEIS